MSLTFGDALKAAKEGAKIARHEWGNADQFVVYQKGYPDGIPCNKQTAEAWGMKEGDLFKCKPYLQIRCADGSHMMWAPSISDVLEEDWCILDTAVTQKKEPVSQLSLGYYSSKELIETNCAVPNAKDIFDIKYTNNISTEEAAER